MTFANPQLLLTLLALPAAGAVYLAARQLRVRHAVRFTNLDVLAQVAGGAVWRRRLPPALFAVTLALLCVAAARPQVSTLATTDRTTVILVLDASLSMHATDVRPSRLRAAQAGVRTFLDRVPKRVLVGLVVFAGEAQVGAPPTTDRGLLRESVDSIGESGGFGGTAIGDALALAVDLGGRTLWPGSPAVAVAHPAAARGVVSILFLSDGRQTTGTVQPLDAARRARAAGMRVYTVALGTDHGQLPADVDTTGLRAADVTPQELAPDPATLRSIAETTGGEFFRAETASALRAAYAGLGTRLAGRTARTEITYAFVACAAAILLAGGVLSLAWSPRLP